MNKTIYVVFSTLFFCTSISQAAFLSPRIFWLDDDTIIAAPGNSLKLINVKTKQILFDSKTSFNLGILSKDKKLMAFNSSPGNINILDIKTFKILKSLPYNEQIEIYGVNNKNVIIQKFADSTCHSFNWHIATKIAFSKANSIPCPEENSFPFQMIGDNAPEKFIIGNLTLSPVPGPATPEDTIRNGIRIADTKTNKEINFLPPMVSIEELSPSPNRTKFAFYHGDDLLLWHFTRRPVFSMPLQEGAIFLPSPDMSIVATGNKDDGVKIIDTKTGTVKSTISQDFDTASFSWNNKLFVTGCSPNFNIYEVATGKLIDSRPGTSDKCVLKPLPNNQILTVSSGAVVDVISGKPVDYNILDMYQLDKLEQKNGTIFENSQYIINRDEDIYTITDKKTAQVKLQTLFCHFSESFDGVLDNHAISVWEQLGPSNGVSKVYDLDTHKLIAVMPDGSPADSENNHAVRFPNGKIEIWPSDPATWPLEVIYSPVHFTEQQPCEPPED